MSWYIPSSSLLIVLFLSLLSSGEKYYLYDGRVAETPKGGMQIKKGLSSSLPKSITAALHNQDDGTTDFIRGKKVWRFDEISRELVDGFPKRLNTEIFPEVPNKPTAAFLDKFGMFYIAFYFLSDSFVQLIDD